MTLFLLLVTIAAIAPFVGIAIEARQLGIVGSLVGFSLAALLAAGQFAGHHQLLYRMQGKLKQNWTGSLVVVVYYVAILAIGMLCTQLTSYLARQTAGWHA